MPEFLLPVFQAARSLSRSRRFTVFCILTLGISVGVGTAIYSVIHATLFRTVPLPHLEQLVNLYHTDPRERGGIPAISFSRPDFDDLLSEQRAFDRVAAYTPFQLPVIAHGMARPTRGEVVTAEYFTVVAITPLQGRVFGAHDANPGAPPVAVISERLRRRLFATSDPIGAVVNIRGRSFQIVGVVTFSGLAAGELLPTDIWLPESAATTVLDRNPREREGRGLLVIARLRAGLTVAHAQTDVLRVAETLDARHPLEDRASRGGRKARAWVAIPTKDIRFHGQDSRFFRPLANAVMSASFIVLLVACTNLANLMLARQAARREELAIKLALGASRASLVREQILESALLTAGGGLVAIAIAAFLMAMLRAEIGVGSDTVIRFQPRLEPAVFLAAALGTFLSLLLVSLAPAYRASQLVPRASLQNDAGQAFTVRWTARRWLIILQVAASVLFLSLAGQAAAGVWRVQREQLGTLAQLSIVRLTTTDTPMDGRRAARLLSSLRATGAVPAHAPLALTNGIPGLIDGTRAQLLMPGASAIGVEAFTGTRDLLVALDLPLTRGSEFREGPSERGECVISDNGALRAFGSLDAIGRTVTLQWPAPPRTRTCVIVGTVADTGGHRAGISGQLFMPFTDGATGDLTVFARSQDPARLAGIIASGVPAIDAGAAPVFTGTGEDAVGPQTVVLRAAVALTLLLGALSLALALFGIYGVMSQMVIARTREIGLRLALGGTHSQVGGLMLRQGFEPVLVGTFAGLIVAAVLMLTMARATGMQSGGVDFIGFLMLPVPALAVAFAACFVPVRRATSISPAVTLRSY